tara:strand:- start:1630 stop:1905 length:276 start_codon:yes stop_codon:yes gene_type:complete
MAGKKARPKGAKGSNGLALVCMVTGGLVALVMLGVGISMLSSSSPAPATKPAASAATPSLYDLVAAKADGQSLAISSLRGKALLMLNVASR